MPSWMRTSSGVTAGRQHEFRPYCGTPSTGPAQCESRRGRRGWAPRSKAVDNHGPGAGVMDPDAGAGSGPLKRKGTAPPSVDDRGRSCCTQTRRLSRQLKKKNLRGDGMPQTPPDAFHHAGGGVLFAADKPKTPSGGSRGEICDAMVSLYFVDWVRWRIDDGWVWITIRPIL